MSFSRKKPYNDLPLLLPDKSVWESINVYKKLAEARAALAELKGRLPIIPNPLMLINTLVLQEAKDSSTIENIFTTKLFHLQRQDLILQPKKFFATAKPCGMHLLK
jgi:Fic family protein